MSLAWTTVAVLVLLLPGFFYFVGLRLKERIARDARAQHAFEQLAGIVFIAFLVHGVYYLTSPLFCGTWPPCVDLGEFFAVITLDAADNASVAALVMKIDSDVPWIVAYVALTTVGAGVAGWLVARFMTKGFLGFLARHKWVHELPFDRDGFTKAYVLTNLKEGNRVLMYRGTLRDFYFRADGQISYLVLVSCVRYYMVFDDDPRTTLPVEIGRTTGALLPSYLFVVEGEDIANVVFESFPVRFSKKGLEELDAATGTQPNEEVGTRDRVA